MTDAERQAMIAERLKFVAAGGFDGTCGFRAVSFGAGEAVVELDVLPKVQNIIGALHGGATATLVDHAGTLAIVTADRDARPGVTTDLNVTYLAPGTGTVVAHAKVLKVGKTMAYVTVDITRKADGVLVAQGRMTKFQGL